MRTISAIVGLILIAIGSLAQAPNTLNRPSTFAHSVEVEPKVDGEVINDPVWQEIEMVTQSLIQMKPDQGQPASGAGSNPRLAKPAARRRRIAALRAPGSRRTRRDIAR